MPPVIEKVASRPAPANESAPSAAHIHQRIRLQSSWRPNNTNAPATAKNTGMMWHSAVSASSAAAHAR